MPKTELPTEPGIYPGLTMNQYRQIDAVNQSHLSTILERTAGHAHYERTHPKEPTDAQVLGDAIHARLLEPERSKHEYVRGPTLERRSKKDKEAWAELAEKHPDAVVLRWPDDDAVNGIAKSVRRNRDASAILDAPGHVEMTVLWYEDITGLLCKARLDKFLAWEGDSVIFDLKSTVNAHPQAFGKSVANYRYHVQAAFYLDALNAHAPADRRFVFGCFEKSEPYPFALCDLESIDLEQGRHEYRHALRIHARCTETGEWPFYGNAIHRIGLPKWARANYEE